MQISAASLTARSRSQRLSCARRKTSAWDRSALKPVRAVATETEADAGPYGNGYIPYPLPFGKKRVYVWERPPPGVTASMIFKPRKSPENHFEQYWYDFLYLYPELSEWQIKLQEWANKVYGAPKYKWAEIYNRLRAKNVKTVTAEEAYSMLQKPSFPFGGKTILIDVREKQRYERSHAGGSINVPFFDVGIPPKNQAELIRQVSYFFLGMQVPTLNPTFVDEVTSIVGGKKNTRILIMCQVGGTLENIEERKKRNPRLPKPPLGDFGQSSRSLMAVHDLVCESGFTNVLHVGGGIGSWKVDGFPMEYPGLE